MLGVATQDKASETATPDFRLLPTASFACAVVACGRVGWREVVVSACGCGSPRLAVRWLRSEARRLAGLLAPDPGSPFFGGGVLVPGEPGMPRPDIELRAWAGSEARYGSALAELAAGRPFVLSVVDCDAVYALRALPVPVRLAVASSAPAPARCLSVSRAGAGRHRRVRDPWGPFRWWAARREAVSVRSVSAAFPSSAHEGEGRPC